MENFKQNLYVLLRLIEQKIKNTSVLASILLCFSNLAWCSDTISEHQWLQDIDVYVEQLENSHMNLFHSTSKKHFEDAVNTLRSQIPTLTGNQILVRLMKLTRMVEDGHTSFPLWGPTLHRFPVKFIAIEKRLFVTATTNEHEILLKSELVSINGKSVEEIFESLAQHVPFSENPYSTAVRVAQYFPIAELLNGAGFIDADYEASFSFVGRSDNTITKTLKAKTNQHFQKVTNNDLLSSLDKQVSESDWLWFASSADKQSIYIKFEQYVAQNRMENFASTLLNFINQNKSENLIIDLRDNFGGDFFVGLELAQHLVLADSINWRTGVYVLMNNVTFSAAMSNAAQFKSILNAQLIGEPSGGRPKGYQDMGEFTLPNSQRVVTYSKRFYDFIGSDLDAIYPDKTIKTSVTDFRENSDRQLNWIFNRVGWR